MISDATKRTLGAILAGGLARRLGGGDKTLRSVGGRTVLARLVDRLAPQVVRLVLNANDDPRRFQGLVLPVVADSLPGHPGPLAGVLAVLEWAAETDPTIEWVLTVPGDTPFIPSDLAARLHSARRSDRATFVCAASQGRIHPVVALWPVDVNKELRAAVELQGLRRVDDFIRRHVCSTVDWPTDPADPFFNVNTPDDLAEAERLVTLHPWL